MKEKMAAITTTIFTVFTKLVLTVRLKCQFFYVLYALNALTKSFLCELYRIIF